MTLHSTNICNYITINTKPEVCTQSPLRDAIVNVYKTWTVSN